MVEVAPLLLVEILVVTGVPAGQGAGAVTLTIWAPEHSSLAGCAQRVRFKNKKNRTSVDLILISLF